MIHIIFVSLFRLCFCAMKHIIITSRSFHQKVSINNLPLFTVFLVFWSFLIWKNWVSYSVSVISFGGALLTQHWAKFLIIKWTGDILTLCKLKIYCYVCLYFLKTQVAKFVSNFVKFEYKEYPPNKTKNYQLHSNLQYQLQSNPG